MSRTSRVLFVVQRYGEGVVGGAESYVQTLATGLAAQGLEVHVITSCATSYADWADVFEPGTVVQSGVVVHRVPVRAPRDNDRFIPLHLRAVQAFETPLWPWAQDRWSQMMGPDLDGVEPLLAREAEWADVTVLVGYHYAPTLRLTSVAAAFGPTVVVPTAHPEGAFHVGWVDQMFAHADHVLCLAHEEADLVRRNHPTVPGISVVGCPVAPIEPPTTDVVERATARFGVRAGGYGVVVGRVDPAKGSDDAIHFTRLYRRCVDPDFELVVIGPGGDGAAGDGVRPTGFVDEADKVALVAGAGVVVQPSYMESFSLALMEGWLLRRPALVQRRSRVLAGHVARSGGGLDYGGYLDFEAALTTLRRRPDLAERMGAAGDAYVRREFAWHEVAAEVVQVLDRAVERGGRRLARKDSISR